MQLILQSEILKETLEFAVKQSWKEKNMENSHAMVEFWWRQKRQQAEAHYIENSQLH